MELVVLVSGACLVVLMLLVVSWLTDLERRVRRLEQPRAPVSLTAADFADDLRVLPPGRRRSSGAE